MAHDDFAGARDSKEIDAIQKRMVDASRALRLLDEYLRTPEGKADQDGPAKRRALMLESENASGAWLALSETGTADARGRQPGEGVTGG
jgi:hypothetical protein